LFLCSASSTLFPYTTLFRSGISRTICCGQCHTIESDIATVETALIDRERNTTTVITTAAIYLSRCDSRVATSIQRYCDVLAYSEDRKSTRLNSSHVKISYAV